MRYPNLSVSSRHWLLLAFFLFWSWHLTNISDSQNNINSMEQNIWDCLDFLSIDTEHSGDVLFLFIFFCFDKTDIKIKDLFSILPDDCLFSVLTYLDRLAFSNIFFWNCHTSFQEKLQKDKSCVTKNALPHNQMQKTQKRNRLFDNSSGRSSS